MHILILGATGRTSNQLLEQALQQRTSVRVAGVD